jgi:hypothetical protein
MELYGVSFEALSHITYRFATGEGPETGCRVLAAAFSGHYGIGARGSNDAVLIQSMLAAALTAWEPFGLVLDLRDLAYEWGDEMTDVLLTSDPCDRRRKLPVAVLVSSKCREGLTSLVQEFFGDDPLRWLFDTLEEAVQAIERKVPPSLRRTRDGASDHR